MSTAKKNNGGRSVKNTPPGPKKTKNRRKGQNTRGVRQSRIVKNSVMLCSYDYMHALTDPFGYREVQRLPCVPDFVNTPSYKVGTTVRANFAIGTQGFGFIQIAPFTFASDEIFGSKSGTTYAGTTCVVDTAITGVSTFTDARYPYPATGSTRPARLVACGLRVRYTGTELNRGGRIIPIACLGRGDSTQTLDVTKALQKPDVRVEMTNRAWHGCRFAPIERDQYDFIDVSYSITNSPVNARLAVLVEGSAGNTFEAEIVRYFEILPDTVANLSVPFVSASDSDPIGLGAVRDFLGKVSNSEVGQSLWNRGLQFLKESFVVAAPLAVGYGAQRASQPRLEYL